MRVYDWKECEDKDTPDQYVSSSDAYILYNMLEQVKNRMSHDPILEADIQDILDMVDEDDE